MTDVGAGAAAAKEAECVGDATKTLEDAQARGKRYIKGRIFGSTAAIQQITQFPLLLFLFHSLLLRATPATDSDRQRPT